MAEQQQSVGREDSSSDFSSEALAKEEASVKEGSGSTAPEATGEPVSSVNYPWTSVLSAISD
jgi:hypothetical protein